MEEDRQKSSKLLLSTSPHLCWLELMIQERTSERFDVLPNVRKLRVERVSDNMSVLQRSEMSFFAIYSLYPVSGLESVLKKLSELIHMFQND